MTPTDWQETTLGDLLKVKHGYAFKGKHITTENTGKVLVTPGNFYIGGGFKGDKFKFYTAEYPSEYELCEDDIVVTMTDLSKEGDTLGYSAKIPKAREVVFLHNQRIGKVLFVDQNIEKDFIYWLMRTKEYQQFIVGSASGTSIRHTAPSTIQSYKFFLPPLPEQRAIADVLSSLDAKIDLLHRQNQTLEALAETLFRQWFIEEANPDWEDKSLSFFGNIICGKTPSKKNLNYFAGNIPFIKIPDMHNKVYVSQTTDTLTELGRDSQKSKTLPAESICVSCIATVGLVCFNAYEAQTNQQINSIIPNQSYYRYFWRW